MTNLGEQAGTENQFLDKLKGKFVQVIFRSAEETEIKKGICEGGNNGFLFLRTLKNLLIINLKDITEIKVIGEGRENAS